MPPVQSSGRCSPLLVSLTLLNARSTELMVTSVDMTSSCPTMTDQRLLPWTLLLQALWLSTTRTMQPKSRCMLVRRHSITKQSNMHLDPIRPLLLSFLLSSSAPDHSIPASSNCCHTTPSAPQTKHLIMLPSLHQPLWLIGRRCSTSAYGRPIHLASPELPKQTSITMPVWMHLALHLVIFHLADQPSRDAPSVSPNLLASHHPTVSS